MTQNEIPNLINDINNFNINSKTNLDSIRQILKEEINYIKNLLKYFLLIFYIF